MSIREALLLQVIKECQRVLLENLIPDSLVSDSETINKLLSILDDSAFVAMQREIESAAIKADVKKQLAACCCGAMNLPNKN